VKAARDWTLQLQSHLTSHIYTQEHITKEEVIVTCSVVISSVSECTIFVDLPVDTPVKTANFHKPRGLYEFRKFEILFSSSGVY
jgi:hypothetical protein